MTITLCRQRIYVYDACTNKAIETAAIGGFKKDPDKPGWYLGEEVPADMTTVWAKDTVMAEGYKDVPLDYVPCKEDINVGLQVGVSTLEVTEKIPAGVNIGEMCTQRFHVYDAYTRQPIEDVVITTSIHIWSKWDSLRNIATDVGNGWYDASMSKWRNGGVTRPVTTVYIIAPGYATPSVTFMHCKKDLEVPMMPGNSARDVFEYLGAAAIFSGDVEGMLCRQRYFVFDAITGKPLTKGGISKVGFEQTAPVSGEPGWYLSGRMPKWGPPPPPFVKKFPRPVVSTTASADGYESTSIEHIVCKKHEYIPLMPLCRTMDELPRTCPVAIPDVPYVDPGVFVPPPVIGPSDVTLVPDEMTQLVCKSTPTDADVSIMEAVSGNVIATGKSPITYRVPVAHDYIVLFEKEGYTTNEVTVVK